MQNNLGGGRRDKIDHLVANLIPCVLFYLKLSGYFNLQHKQFGWFNWKD